MKTIFAEKQSELNFFRQLQEVTVKARVAFEYDHPTEMHIIRYGSQGPKSGLNGGLLGIV